MERRRPNYYDNRYNQWVIAGKIAVKSGAINPNETDGNIASVYKTNDNKLHYSVIGQDYLRKLKLEITEL